MSVRNELLSIRSRIDALLGEMPESATGELSAERFMTVPDFAALRNYSTRSIRDWCELGMPHTGTGRRRRIHVHAAIAWIEGGGPKRTKTSR